MNSLFSCSPTSGTCCSPTSWFLPSTHPIPVWILSFFARWKTIYIRTRISNIRPDAAKLEEVVCVLTRASSAIDYTTCNDINYAALGALTSKMANAADSGTPCRGEKAAHMVSGPRPAGQGSSHTLNSVCHSP